MARATFPDDRAFAVPDACLRALLPGVDQTDDHRQVHRDLPVLRDAV